LAKHYSAELPLLYPAGSPVQESNLGPTVHVVPRGIRHEGLKVKEQRVADKELVRRVIGDVVPPAFGKMGEELRVLVISDQWPVISSIAAELSQTDH
jgi:hypothetical protein